MLTRDVDDFVALITQVKEEELMEAEETERLKMEGLIRQYTPLPSSCVPSIPSKAAESSAKESVPSPLPWKTSVL